MGRVILPESVERRHRYERMLEVTDRGYLKYWNERLAEVKPGLSLVFARDTASMPGLVPGCWHVRWRDPYDKGAPDTYLAITTDGIGVHGGYREMGSDVIEWFRRADLWNRSVVADRERKKRLADEAMEREKARQKEGRVDEIATNIRALDRTSAVFNTDLSWTNRAGARKDAA